MLAPLFVAAAFAGGGSTQIDNPYWPMQPGTRWVYREVERGHVQRVVRDSTPLEPRVLEYKLYARGVGPVLTLGVSGGAGREELVRLRKGR